MSIVTFNNSTPLRTRTSAPLQFKNSYLLGHRGARGEALENSVAGFIHLQQLSKRHPQQLIGIEFDIQLTADNQLFVYHDDNLKRLHQRQSRIDQCTKQQLLQHHLQQSKQHIFLEDMAQYLTNYRRIELEVKTHQRTDYPRLLQALRQALQSPKLAQLPITLTSFDVTLHQHLLTDTHLNHLSRALLVEPKQLPTTAAQINQINIDTEMTTNAALKDTSLVAKRLGCQGVGLYYLLYSQPLMQSFQRHQLTTTAWTVNDAQAIQHLIGLRVDYIITDYPTRFVACFE